MIWDPSMPNLTRREGRTEPADRIVRTASGSESPRRLKLLVLILAGVIVLGLILIGQTTLPHLLNRLEEPLVAMGLWAYPVYVFCFALGLIVLTPAWPMAMLAGILFQPWWLAIGLVSAGNTLGCWGSFLIARSAAGERARNRLERSRTFHTIDRAICIRGAWFLLLLRICPLIPYHVLNYGLGLTQIRPSRYLLTSWLGMLPMSIASVTTARILDPDQRVMSGQPLWFWGIAVGLGVVLLGVVSLFVRRALDAQRRDDSERAIPMTTGRDARPQAA